MQDSSGVKESLKQMVKDSKQELSVNPTASTGKCVISSAGWSECKSPITKAACYKQKGPGVTVKWYKDESC